MPKLDLDALARAVNGDVTVFHKGRSFYRVTVVGIVGGRNRIDVDVTGTGYVEAVEAAARQTAEDVQAVLTPLKEHVEQMDQALNLLRHYVVRDW